MQKKIHGLLLLIVLCLNPARGNAASDSIDRLHEIAPKLKIYPEPKSADPLLLDHWKGKSLVLHFWASWCDACKEEMPELVHFVDSLGPGWVFLAVSTDVGPEKKELARNVFNQLKLKSSLYFLDDQDPAKKYTAWGVPVTYFVQSSGEMVARVVGRRPWKESFPDVQKFIQSLRN